MPKTRSRFKVVTKDKGWGALLKRMEAAKGARVKIGVLGSKATTAHTGSLSNGDLAFLHEFGAPGANIPARSFIRAPFDKNRAEYLALLRKLTRSYFEGKMTLERALGLVGAKIAADFKRNVTEGAGIPPPLAPATIRRKQRLTRPGSKGSVRALIDTGRLVGSIAWSVRVGAGAQP